MGKVKINYPEDLVMAVMYLHRKGLNSRKIAERLEVSPFTVRSILHRLRKEGLLDKSKKVKEKQKKHKDVIEEILHGE